MNRTVFAFGTYPIERPVHGGQRRTAAFRSLYRRMGCAYRYLCVYDSDAYPQDLVGKDDCPYVRTDPTLSDVPFVMDLDAGEQAAGNDMAYAHFASVIAQAEPVAFVLEQPFLWPLVKRLRDRGGYRHVPVIYASHNVEGPLKEEILRTNGFDGARARAIGERIARLEQAIVAEASLVLTVSDADAAVYGAMPRPPSQPILVVRNGVEPVTPPAEPGIDLHGIGERPFFLFVGSAYPPNVRGFGHFVLTERLFFLPPEKRLAVCGGASDGIFTHPLYSPFMGSYSRRVQFFTRIDDLSLAYLKAHAHAMLLPIHEGGGSNLKTAEALLTGAHVIASPLALRSFEEFMDAPGVKVAETPRAFFDAMVETLAAPRLVLDAAEVRRRQTLSWDGIFAASGVEAALDRAMSGGPSP